MISIVRIVLALGFLATSAAAESVAVVVDPRGVGLERAQKTRSAAEAALRELSAFRWEALALHEVSRGCDQAECLVQLAKGTGKDFALVLAPSPRRLEVHWVDVAQGRTSRRVAEGEGEAAVRALVEAMLPAYARKGWGGLVLDAPLANEVKLDGRPVQLLAGAPWPVVAGEHTVDVRFPGDEAMLHRLRVPEGERVRLSVSPRLAASGEPAARAGDRRLRLASYGLWSAGALAVAGAFIAGAASRHAAAGLAPCDATRRSCLSYDEAFASHQRAQAYARTGDVLLGAGMLVGGAGAGLFFYDARRRGGEE
ncbi:MAG: hypothetical protein ACOZIN_04365 [Myxococcota bacterium]